MAPQINYYPLMDTNSHKWMQVNLPQGKCMCQEIELLIHSISGKFACTYLCEFVSICGMMLTFPQIP